MSQYYNYLIQPQAPLVFKTGRPFGAGGRDGANFPWPSSVAGMFRTCIMQDKGWNYVDEEGQQKLLSLATQGPLLIHIKGDGERQIMVPRPMDGIYLLNSITNKKEVCRLVPKSLPQGCYCNLPDGLLPVQLVENRKDKSQIGPEFWPLKSLLAWQRGENVDFDSLPTECLTIDSRSHVAIDSDTYASKEGALFQVQGLDFLPAVEDKKEPFPLTSFALVAGFSEKITSRMITLGGKRRLSWLTETPQTMFSCPEEHIAVIPESKGITMTVVTPALLDNGWKPGWLDENLVGTPPGCEGVILKLRAVAIGRWQGLSGWDLKEQKPKPARKAVAAGSVYWFEIVDGFDFKWKKIWLSSICDKQQDRYDGFGQIVPGPWLCKTKEGL